MTTDIGYPETGRRLRCALFVDFDNVYLGLRRLDPAAAEEFAGAPGRWLSALESGSDVDGDFTRRFLIRSCYLNPSAFSQFRPNFTRAGFSVVDCPSLTQQGKSSADINLVLDAVDALAASTHYDEFVILSADADFTPLALRCRAADRRVTIITAGPAASAYRAVADTVVTADELAELVRDPNGIAADEAARVGATDGAPARAAGRRRGGRGGGGAAGASAVTGGAAAAAGGPAGGAALADAADAGGGIAGGGAAGGDVVGGGADEATAAADAGTSARKARPSRRRASSAAGADAASADSATGSRARTRGASSGAPAAAPGASVDEPAATVAPSGPGASGNEPAVTASPSGAGASSEEPAATTLATGSEAVTAGTGASRRSRGGRASAAQGAPAGAAAAQPPARPAGVDEAGAGRADEPPMGPGDADELPAGPTRPGSPARRAVLRQVRAADRPLRGGLVARAAQNAEPGVAAGGWDGAGGFFPWIAREVPEVAASSEPAPGFVWDPQRFSEADLPGSSVALPPLQRQVVDVTDIPNLPTDRYRVLLTTLADDVATHPFERAETARRVRDACQAAGQPIGRSSVNTVIEGVLYAGLDLTAKPTAEQIAETWADHVIGLCRGARMVLSPADVTAIRTWVSGGLVPPR